MASSATAIAPTTTGTFRRPPDPPAGPREPVTGETVYGAGVWGPYDCCGPGAGACG